MKQIPKNCTVTPPTPELKINLQIHIDSRMPADKLDLSFECMDKYILCAAKG